MKVNRGDVVLIDHPFSDASGSKVRPVLANVPSGIAGAGTSKRHSAWATARLRPPKARNGYPTSVPRPPMTKLR